MVPPKRRERDSQMAKETILLAARDIFARDGFGAARVDAVAAASGYNKSLIFQYFGDKLGLYQAVVQCAKEQVLDDLFELALAGLCYNEQLTETMVREALATLIRKYFDYLLAHPHLVRIMAWEAAEGWHAYTMMHHAKLTLPRPLKDGEQHRSRLQLVSKYLRKAQAQSFIRAEVDPDLLLAYVLDLCTFHLISLPRYQLLLPGRDFSSPEALTHAREQIVILILHGALMPS